MKKLVPSFIVFLFILNACSITFTDPTPISDADAVATAVQAALDENVAAQNQDDTTTDGDSSADPTRVVTAKTAVTEEPADAVDGTVSGHICFPSEGIPEMTLYVVNVQNNDVTNVPIAQNQTEYSTQVGAGNYNVYAWLPDFVYGGSYSNAVACGLDVSCTDHSLTTVIVNGGEETLGVDVCDWYGGPDDVPFPPGEDASGVLGSISGQLGYPSEGIPPLEVVAFNIDINQWFYVLTQQNQTTYEIENLPPGNYQVVAFVAGEDYGGGYSEYVTCGLLASCTSHVLITVSVKPGQEKTGVNPTDFYAPDGSFPNNPN
ncbi:MAG: hypothetical protein N2D54_09440 [Chloroflexota bacterium]